MDIDGGHSYAYNIMGVFFPAQFELQALKTAFAIYEAVPGLLDPRELRKEKVSETLSRKHASITGSVSKDD